MGFRNYSFEPSGFCRVGDDTEADTCTKSAPVLPWWI